MATDENKYNVDTDEGLTHIENALDKRLGEYDTKKSELQKKDVEGRTTHFENPLNDYLGGLKSHLENDKKLNDGFDFPTITEKVNNKISTLTSKTANNLGNTMKKTFRPNLLNAQKTNLERLKEIQTKINILTPIYNPKPKTSQGNKGIKLPDTLESTTTYSTPIGKLQIQFYLHAFQTKDDDYYYKKKVQDEKNPSISYIHWFKKTDTEEDKQINFQDIEAIFNTAMTKNNVKQIKLIDDTNIYNYNEDTKQFEKVVVSGGKRKTRKRKSTTKRRKTTRKSKRKHSKKRKLHRK